MKVGPLDLPVANVNQLAMFVVLVIVSLLVVKNLPATIRTKVVPTTAP